jgi:hypothetical protein
MESINKSFLELKSQLRANLVDVVDYFTTSIESLSMVLLMLGLSALLVCIGLNFNQSIVIYGGVLISPFVINIIQLTIAIYQNDIQLLKSSLIKIFFGTLLTIVIGYLYFKLTPFATDLNSLKTTSEIGVPIYLAVFILGITMDIFNRHRIPIIIWVLKILFKWSAILILVGFSMTIGDMEWFRMMMYSYSLIFLFFFIGFTALLWSFKIDRKDIAESKFKLLFPIITILSFVFGIYFGLNELMRLTTNYNAECYIHQGIHTKNFTVHNFTIEKSTKDIKVFYSGMKPAMTQDEALKKKYNLSGYHIEYIDIKQ